MSVCLVIFLIAIALMFVTGFYCLIMTRNLIRILIALEILTKAATLLLITAGYISGKMATAQAFAITLIIVEVVVIAIAAGIVLGAYRHNETLDTRKLNNLKG